MEEPKRRGRPRKNPEAKPKSEKQTKAEQNLAKARKMLERPSDRLTEEDHKFIREAAKYHMSKIAKENPRFKTLVSDILFTKPESTAYIEDYIGIAGLKTFFFMKTDHNTCHMKGTVQEVAEMMAHQMESWDEARDVILTASRIYMERRVEEDAILGTA
jgi:hypothetical protein